MTAAVYISENSRAIFRYALGATLMVGLAMGYNWELSFLLPVLGLDFLSPGKSRPTLYEGLRFLFTISLASLVGLFFSYFFLSVPFIHILITFLLLLHVFYTNSRFFGPMIKVWLIIAVLLIPNIGLLSLDLAETIAISLVINAVLAILVVWFTYTIFPAVPKAKVTATTQPQKANPGKFQRFEYAITNTLIIMPVYLVFYYYEMSSYILILIFIALLSMQPAFAKDFKGGIALIMANLIGGLLAISSYEVLTVVPVFSYFLLIVLLCGLYLGFNAFSEKKTARLFAMAFSTYLLIICSVTGFGTIDAGTKLWSRIFQIMIAVIYVVTAFGLVHRFKRKA